jgi:flap endonuclease-1
MGIKGLMKLIADNAPNSFKEDKIDNYFGRRVAIDASMSMYQFIIAVRPDQGMLTDEVGETTRSDPRECA